MPQTTAWNPDSYAKNARFVSDLGESLIDLLQPKPGEAILDLGCGDGALTEKIAAAGCAVIGVDSSREFLEAARARGLAVALMDGHRLALKRRFDAAFSNAALHWMKRPEKVVEGGSFWLKPAGRFVGALGGEGNVQTIRRALHAGLAKHGIDPWSADPWYYPSPQDYTALLGRFGFTVRYIELIPRPTKLPGDIGGWLEVFAQPFTKSVPGGQKSTFLAQVRNALEPLLLRPDGSWYADYVRLRFKAVLGKRPVTADPVGA